MEEAKNNSGQNLGIAALITAIITFVLAVIPCVGMIAIIPGIIAIVLAAVGLNQAQKDDSPRGVILAGLIIGIVAVLISFSQSFFIHKFAEGIKSEKWPQQIEKIVNDVQENVVKDIDDANVSIKVNDGENNVEINVSTGKSDKEKTLEELEKGNTSGHDSVTAGK
ncbi:MAG: hypothetical protein NT092_03810 [Bacteroidia bacterium]|nr:hypothetical protein [Bacteroidia bacterium]